MFGLLKTPREKAFALKDFIKWAKASEKAMGNGPKFMQVNKKALSEYYSLITPEQKLYAAYTSLNSLLKNSVKSDLEHIGRERTEEAIHNVYLALEEKGKHGCSHLLKCDYKEFFDNDL